MGRIRRGVFLFGLLLAAILLCAHTTGPVLLSPAVSVESSEARQPAPAVVSGGVPTLAPPRAKPADGVGPSCRIGPRGHVVLVTVEAEAPTGSTAHN